MSETLKSTSSSISAERSFRTEHLKADLKNRSVRGGVITITNQITKIVLLTGSTIVLARMLTPEDYGLIGMVKAVTGLIGLFKDLGLSMATIQRAEINHSQVSTLFWINVFISIGLAIVTAAIAPGVAWFYGEPRLTLIMLVLAIGYIFSGTGAQHQALLGRQMRYRSLAIVDIAGIVASIVVAIILAWFGAQYWALVFMALTSTIVHTAGYWFVSGWLPGRPRWESGVSSMLTFGSGLTGSSLISYFTRNFDNVLIGWYWGPKELGLYTRAYQLLVLPLISVNSPIRAVAINALSRLKESPERYRRAYLRILEKITMLAMPFVALLIATSDWLILFLLGPQWSDVSSIFGWLSLVALSLPVMYTTGWLFISQGRTWEMFRLGTITGTITVAAFVISLPWGASGVAAAYSISGLCISMPLQYWYAGRKGPVSMSDFYRTMAPSLLSSLCVLLVLFAFRQWVEVPNPLVGLAIACAITLVTALSVFALLPSGRVALQDVRNLLTVIYKRKRNKPSL